MTDGGRIDAVTELTLTAFLAARLDEDEAWASEAHDPGRRWLAEDNAISLWPERDDDAGFMSFPTRAHARLAAGWNPARVLAELAAKRAIIQAWILRDQQGSGPGEGAATIASHAVGVLVALKHLAAVHADHPDYRHEWAP